MSFYCCLGIFSTTKYRISKSAIKFFSVFGLTLTFKSSHSWFRIKKAAIWISSCLFIALSCNCCIECCSIYPSAHRNMYTKCTWWGIQIRLSLSIIAFGQGLSWKLFILQMFPIHRKHKGILEKKYLSIQFYQLWSGQQKVIIKVWPDYSHSELLLKIAITWIFDLIENAVQIKRELLKCWSVFKPFY